MRDFSITLDGREYKVSSVSSNSQGDRSFEFSFYHGDIRVHVAIPIQRKITRAKVMLFIEALHEGVKTAFESQQIEQNYVMNQKHSIS